MTTQSRASFLWLFVEPEDLEVKGLGDVVERTAGERGASALVVGVTGDDDHRQRGVELMQPLEYDVAWKPRHREIKHDAVLIE